MNIVGNSRRVNCNQNHATSRQIRVINPWGIALCLTRGLNILDSYLDLKAASPLLFSYKFQNILNEYAES